MIERLDVKRFEVDDSFMASRAPEEPDVVDARLEVWARELPGLDLGTEGIVERICKLDRYLQTTTEDTIRDFDLSFGEWKLLGYLRAGGPPYRGKPGKLATSLGLSSGAMTNRLDNLERRGLVERLDDPGDRRGVLIELTKLGHTTWDATIGVQAEKEALVASVLTEHEKDKLNELLRRLMHAFDEHHGPLKPRSSKPVE